MHSGAKMKINHSTVGKSQTNERRDDGSFIGNNTNGFAALENLRRNKKSVKEKVSKLEEVSDEKPQVIWAPAPLTVKSWADVEDEEDDDYYATTAPPQAIWGGSGLNKAKESETLDPVEISKKERRKKELAELDAILADFGVDTKEKAEEESSDERGRAEPEWRCRGKAKKKKKKDKVPKDVKEPRDLPKCSEVADRQEQEETAEAVQLVEEASAVDVQERLKKVLSEKKKSSKEMDAGTRMASMEAAARSARLAAAKKKEENHFNQQPTR